MFDKILSIAFTLFLLMDSIGNIPIYLAVLKNCPPSQHKKIILRELLIALAVILGFAFVGNYILNILYVKQYTVMLSGGIILFIIALRMIFPPADEKGYFSKDKDPLIVPLAVPLVAGPAVLASVMLYTYESLETIVIIGGILLAWIVTALILVSAASLKKLLKERGILTLEKLMGLLLTLMAVQMFMQGITAYHKSLL